MAAIAAVASSVREKVTSSLLSRYSGPVAVTASRPAVPWAGQTAAPHRSSASTPSALADGPSSRSPSYDVRPAPSGRPAGIAATLPSSAPPWSAPGEPAGALGPDLAEGSSGVGGAVHGSAANAHRSLSTGADSDASRRTSASTTCGPPALVWSLAT